MAGRCMGEPEILLLATISCLSRWWTVRLPSLSAPARYPVLATEIPSIICRIDARDAIIFVGPGWDEFATRNAAPALLTGTVVGRPIWSQVCDVTTRHIFKLLFQRVRGTGISAHLEFRCDGPEIRRFMR